MITAPQEAAAFDGNVPVPQSIDVALDPRKQAFFDLIGYEPHPWQRTFHWATDHFRFCHSGSGARGGKSISTGAEVAYRTAMFENHWTWLVGETYEAAKKEFFYAREFLTKNLVEAIPGFESLIVKDVFNPEQGSMHLELKNGSWFTAKTADRPNTLLSEELDLVGLCEGSQLPASSWETRLNQRISSRMGQVIVPTTAAGFTWMHDEFFVKALADWAPPGLGYNPLAGYSYRNESDWYRRNDPAVRASWANSYYTQVFPAFASPYYPEEEAARHLARANESGDWHAYYEQVLGLFSQRTGLVIANLPKALRNPQWFVENMGWANA